MNNYSSSDESYYKDLLDTDYECNDMSIVEQYMDNIAAYSKNGKMNMIAPDEVDKLLLKVQTLSAQQGQDAIKEIRAIKNKIMQAHLLLVIKIAKDYKDHWLSALDPYQKTAVRLEDLISIGNEEFYKLMSKYNPNNDRAKFTTYVCKYLPLAVHTVVKDEFAKVDIPNRIYDILKKVKRVVAYDEYPVERFEVEKNIDCLDTLTEIPQKDVKRALTFLGNYAISFDELSQQQIDTSFSSNDEYQMTQRLFIEKLRSDLNKAIGLLTSTEIGIVLMTHGLQDGVVRKKEEIAKTYGLNNTWITKIYLRAMNKMSSSPYKTTLSEANSHFDS